MKLTDSEQALVDKMLVGFTDSAAGWQNYLEVYDDNFEEVSQKVNDGIGSILANAGIAIAEQKKLLQGAKSPSALTNALKLIAVTAGNLVNAGASMLSWMGKQLPQRDSVDGVGVDVDDDVPNFGLNFLAWLGKQLPKRDASPTGDKVVMGVSDGARNYAVVRRDSTDDYAITVSDSFGNVSAVCGGYKTPSAAVSGIGALLK